MKLVAVTHQALASTLWTILGPSTSSLVVNMYVRTYEVRIKVKPKRSSSTNSSGMLLTIWVVRHMRILRTVDHIRRISMIKIAYSGISIDNNH